MRTLNSISKLFPKILLGMYSILFLFIEAEWYFNIYGTVIIYVDSLLLIVSILGLYFFKSWDLVAKLSFKTIILLNILTQIHFEAEINTYYEIYKYVLILFLIEYFWFSNTQK